MDDYTVNEKQVGPFNVRVVYDDDPASSPRDWCNLTVIRGWHRRMVVGDGPNIDSDQYDGWDDMIASVIEEHDAVMVAPLYWYEHSGVTCRMGSPFTPGNIEGRTHEAQDLELSRFRAECLDSGGWDSGVVGLVIVPRAQQAEVGTPDDLIVECARGEVETYAAWLEGRVYGFVVEYVSECDHGHEHAETVDSCWGFVGEDDFALEQGIDAAEAYLSDICASLTRVIA